jgi:hypothetical protein
LQTLPKGIIGQKQDNNKNYFPHCFLNFRSKIEYFIYNKVLQKVNGQP